MVRRLPDVFEALKRGMKVFSQYKHGVVSTYVKRRIDVI